jgi:FkbM family methyltransferase
MARALHTTTLQLLAARGFPVATVLDIGAAEGQFFLYRLQSGLFPAARHFFVDAMQENATHYERLATKFEVEFEIAALSAMEGQIDLCIDPDSYNTHIGHLQPATAYEIRRRVRTTTLDDVVSRRGLKGPFALKIDVQGAELDVLRGAHATLADCVIVTAETPVFAPRDTLLDLLVFMASRGWVLYDLTNLGYYPSDNTLYECYATFIRGDMDFRGGQAWCLEEQSEQVSAVLRARKEQNLRSIDALLALK